jgi:hypothetical protein
MLFPQPDNSPTDRKIIDNTLNRNRMDMGQQNYDEETKLTQKR